MGTNTFNFAEREFDILSKTWATDSVPDDCPVILGFKHEILALCERFGLSGQSGSSAPFVAGAIAAAVKKLCLQEPICPITGIGEEWYNCAGMGASDIDSSEVWQNNRCGALFKNGKDGIPYYLDAIVWKADTEGVSGNRWDMFSGTVEGIMSRQSLQGFPFIPKTFYIDVTKEILPNDWDKEPFIQNECYNTKIFEETGVREWVTEKYRYLIKDKSQLEKVWNYYKKPELLT